MSEYPVVSVGIPTYNRAHFLRQAIDSILAQTYANFELIISDNASTDDTEAVCKEYAARDPRIRYIRQRRNIGGVRNFDETLRVASGEYFMWLADDDLCDNRCIELLASELRAHPDAVLCSPSFRGIDVDGNVLKDYFLERIYPDVPWKKARLAFFEYPIPNVFFSVYGLYRTSVLRKNGCARPILRKRIATNSECPFLARLSTMGRIMAIPEILKYYRWHENSAYHCERKKLNRLDLILVRLIIRGKLISIAVTSKSPPIEKMRMLIRVFSSWFSPERILRGTYRRISSCILTARKCKQ